MTTSSIERTVFVISDSTGITAETFSHSVLSQFQQFDFHAVRVPFIDTIEKAQDVVQRINRCFEETGEKPLVFSTLVDPKMANTVPASMASCFTSRVKFPRCTHKFWMRIEAAISTAPC